MALITLRANTTSTGPSSTTAKTTPLTNVEIDNNFINLNTDSALRMVVGTAWSSGGSAVVGQIIYYSSNLTSATPTINYYQVTAITTGTFSTTAPSHTNGSIVNGGVTLLYIVKPSYLASELLSQIKLVDGSSSGLDADLLDGLSSSTTHVASTSTIVARDTSGNFSATTITADTVGIHKGDIKTTNNETAFTASSKTFTGNFTGIIKNSTGGTAIYTDDSQTVTNSMLFGSIANSKLTNSKITINNTDVSLGGSINILNTSNIWTAQQTFKDNFFSITDDGDNTKVLTFQVANIAAGATRILTAPAADGTIATEDYVQTAGKNSQGAKTIQTISSGVPSNSSGSNGDIIYQY